MKKSVAFLGLVVCVFGCGPTSSGEPATNVPRDPLKSPIVSVKNTSTLPHMAEIDDPKLTVKALLWNERAGYRISRYGFLNHETEFYDQDRYEGTEEKLRQFLPIPNLKIRCGEDEISPTKGTGYSQKINFHSGLLTTNWTQDVSGKPLSISAVSHVSESGDLISELSLSSVGESQVSLTIYSPAFLRKRSEGEESRSVEVEFSNGDITPVRVDDHLVWTETAGPQKPVSFKLVYRSGNRNFPDFSPSATIEIDGPLEDQQFVNSAVYYLSSLLGKNSKMGVSPLGLSGTTYNGHVFWDADVWVFPALALIDPEGATAIPRYRVRMSEAARKNFKGRHSFAIGARELGPELDLVNGVQFPWESSVSGLEVCMTEARQQHHITASVMYGLSLADDLGLMNHNSVQKVGELAANFYDYRAMDGKQVSNENSKRSIGHTLSPDEFHLADDDLYTNIAAEQVMRRYGKGMENVEFFRPRDEKSFLNYSEDRLRGYKQAAGVLAIYPLQDPAVEKEAKIMLDRFADKVTENGPAMSDSVHALIWARLGETEKAYETWHKSWKPFTQHPLLLFSEKKRKEVTYFTTGAAGSLQTVLYGFLGFRLDYKKQPGAAWSTPLRNGRWLSVKPNLPKEWKKVTLRNFSVLGKRYTLTATHTSVNVSLEKN